ncbi:hypothetical protein FRC15_004539 [Serendipita sp. 397]|nr:hypothetical protein FRC15_004539 [Serendipita sp. 397]
MGQEHKREAKPTTKPQRKCDSTFVFYNLADRLACFWGVSWCLVEPLLSFGGGGIASHLTSHMQPLQYYPFGVVSGPHWLVFLHDSHPYPPSLLLLKSQVTRLVGVPNQPTDQAWSGLHFVPWPHNKQAQPPSDKRQAATDCKTAC